MPTNGQGAATTLDDGVCVGRIVGGPVAGPAELASGMAAFDAASRSRCHPIARQAELIARFGADLGGGWRVAGGAKPVRNSLLRLVPAAVLTRSRAPSERATKPAG
ncbi:hypothetical protein [Embleya sp. NPDC055610]